MDNQNSNFPITIEVIIHKNGMFYRSQWFTVNTTKNSSNCGIKAIDTCCSDLITEFRQGDIVNFYLNRGLLNSLSKTRIKSKILAAFIETLDYLASITLNKCNFISSTRVELPSTGLPPAFKWLLIVNPTPKELKTKIKDHF